MKVVMLELPSGSVPQPRCFGGPAAGEEVGPAEGVVVAFAAAQGGDRFAVGAEAAALGRGRHLHRPLALLGDDVDDAADGVAAPLAGRRPAQHLDAFDVVGGQPVEVEGVGSRVLEVHPLPVDQHGGMAGIRAAKVQLGQRPLPAAALHADAGRVLQDILDLGRLAVLDRLVGDHRHRPADPVQGGGGTVGRHHHLVQNFLGHRPR
jgi:hypothetical protein